MIKKILFWSIVVVLILLALVSYLGYRSFNQEAFKNQIVSNIQKLTGRTFVVNGPYKLTWNPLPTMTLENVSLANIENSPNTEMFKADKIQIQIEWASLFTNPTRIKNIIVTNPHILIERIGRSVTNINFPSLFTATDTVNTENVLGESRTQPQIDNIHIENGELQYINQMTKQNDRLSQLTGEIAVGSLSGPFKFEGTGTWNNVPFQINFSLGTYEISKPIEFLSELKAKSSDTHINLDGKLFPDDPEKYLSGNLAFETQKPNTLLRQMRLPALPQANNKETVGNLTFDMSATQTSLSDAVFKFGDGESDMAINFNLKQQHNSKNQELTLNVTSLNLNDWKDTLQSILEQKQLAGIPPTNFRLNIANLLWNGKAATTLQLSGQISPQQIKINSGSILLPGSTTLQLTGLIGTDISSPSGLAEVNLQTQNLPQALPFLPIPQQLLPLLNSAQKAEINTAIEWTPNAKTITIPTLILNDTTGTAHFERDNNSTQIELVLNNINLGHYIQTPDQQISLAQLKEKLFERFQNVTLPEYPLHLILSLNQASFKNVVFEKIVLDTTARTSSLQIEAAGNTTKEDTFVFQSELQNLGTPAWKVVSSAWEIKGQNLSLLLKDLNIDPQYRFLKDTTTFSTKGLASGHSGDWDTTFFYQTQFATLQGKGQIIDQKPQNMAIHLTHTSMPHLMTDLFNHNPLSSLTGTFQGQALLNQTDSTLNFSDVIMAIDEQQANGHIAYNTTTKHIEALLNADKLDMTKLLPGIDLFYSPSSGFDTNPLQFDFLKNLNAQITLNVDTLAYQTTTLKNATIQLHIADDTLTLDDFIATGETQVGASVQATGTLQFAQMPTFNLKFTTQNLNSNTPWAMFDGVGLNGGRLTSEWVLTSSGETPLQMARTLSGQGSIFLKDTAFMGADFPAVSKIIHQAQDQNEGQKTFEPKLKRALANGITPINQIGGNFVIKDGLWQLENAKITADDVKTDTFSLSWDIPTAQVKSSIPLNVTTYPTLPNIVLNFQKDKRGLNYTQEVGDFAVALAKELEQQKTAREEAAIKAKKEQLEKELKAAKDAALAAQQKLLALVSETSVMVNQTPDINTQKSLKMAETTNQNLTIMLQEENLTTLQYKYIEEQFQKAITDLKIAQDILFQQNVKNMKDKATALLPPANDLILKLNEMYQKRPTITLLADLLQNSENQRSIMERAIDQLKKDLTFDQVTKVTKIIEEAHAKITKAYDYAEEIYSGRQSMPSANIIKRAAP
ncbi:MAG: AsmA family protein [Alphaproteobacteria bacterium]|nr:AsmA family protein [Alphaproteobacteria bacterium]